MVGAWCGAPEGWGKLWLGRGSVSLIDGAPQEQSGPEIPLFKVNIQA
jgi:hypothetical protein